MALGKPLCYNDWHRLRERRTVECIMKIQMIERNAVMKGLLGIGLSCTLLAVEAVGAHVDILQPRGPVKPVNGVGQPPMIGAPTGYPMMHYLKEAGIPYSRLHDVGGTYGQLRYVDIPNVFRDFDADESDPKSYSFVYTDSLMKALDENGVEPFFRLGVTIDNAVNKGYPGYFIDPPKDFAKWARICEHVIRHYTEGWANGFRMKVTYWEIWNEPDNEPEQRKNPLWNGSFSEYMRFYGVVATYLKAKFPNLKIGGYGSCGFYAGVGAGQVAAAHSSPRLEYFIDCATNFLGTVRAKGWPLDFFSFHSYSGPTEAMRQVRYADQLLTSYGFTRERTERVFNEWLCYVGQTGTARQAAGIATELIDLQNGPCDIACLYDARCGVGDYSPLFNPFSQKPHKAYFAFVAFNELRKLGTALGVRVVGDSNLHVAAAQGGGRVAVLLANDSDRAISLTGDWGGRRFVSALLTDETRTQAPVADLKTIPPRAFVLAIFRDGR